MEKGGKKQKQIDEKPGKKASSKGKERKANKQHKKQINLTRKEEYIEEKGVGNQGNEGNHGANLNVFDDFSMIFRWFFEDVLKILWRFTTFIRWFFEDFLNNFWRFKIFIRWFFDIFWFF